jgi:predicted RNase H-like HicB family nuclease
MVDLDQEDDDRWIASVPDAPGVMAYGQTREEAIARVQVLAFRVLAEQIESALDESRAEH